MYVCLFVCTLHKSTFLNQSEPNFAHGSPLVWTSSTFWALFSFGTQDGCRSDRLPRYCYIRGSC
jgi:hypothetical protein